MTGCEDPAVALGLRGATANFSTQRTIHESQSFEIVLIGAKRTTAGEASGILAFFATLPGGQRRAKFTMPTANRGKGRHVFDGRSSSVDFLPMTLRTRFLITALFLCHHLPALALVTSQLLAENSPQTESSSTQKTDQPIGSAAQSPSSLCASQAAAQDSDSATICADQQEKDGDVYKLHGNAEIRYRNYILRADEVTYDSNTGEATATGHFTVDGGPNDDHIKASHGTYNLTAETGRFYDVTATTGLQFRGNRVVLTSTAPFAFSGKRVEKDSPDHYLVYDGMITTCELPRPNWKFQARKVVVDVGGNASIYHSKFVLHGFPVFYFPYATHPVAREVRETGFLIPTIGNSSQKGTIIGDGFYWAINPSADLMMGIDDYSRRGVATIGRLRTTPSDTSQLVASYYGVNDQGSGAQRAPGQSIRAVGDEATRADVESYKQPAASSSGGGGSTIGEFMSWKRASNENN